jgi:hypothetical protein
MVRGRAARDVSVGQSWLFREHRTLADADRATRIIGSFAEGFHVIG